MSTGLSYRLRVNRVATETHDSVSVHFRLAPNQREAFGYRPGQFLTLQLPTGDGGHVSRCYSLASAPDIDDDLVVTVKRVADGPGSNWLCDLAGVDGEVEIVSLPPSGTFVPKDLNADLLLVAGGSGITPIMSILTSALARGSGTLTLFYANRDEDSVIFARRLNELAASHPDRLVVHHWIETVQGLPTVDTMRALLSRVTFSDAFICGPTAFMRCVRDALKALGHDRTTVHVEKFNSLASDPFELVSHGPEPDHDAPAGTHLDDAPAPDTGPAQEMEPSTIPRVQRPRTTMTDACDATLVVERDNEEHTFAWPAGTLLLDVLKSNGFKAPSSCTEGVCAACECRKTEGEVEMLNNQVLEDDDIEDGYILACQSVPRSAVVRICYEEV